MWQTSSNCHQRGKSRPNAWDPISLQSRPPVSKVLIDSVHAVNGAKRTGSITGALEKWKVRAGVFEYAGVTSNVHTDHRFSLHSDHAPVAGLVRVRHGGENMHVRLLGLWWDPLCPRSHDRAGVAVAGCGCYVHAAMAECLLPVWCECAMGDPLAPSCSRLPITARRWPCSHRPWPCILSRPPLI
jgi:hypothetical protein